MTTTKTVSVGNTVQFTGHNPEILNGKSGEVLDLCPNQKWVKVKFYINQGIKFEGWFLVDNIKGTG
jgi:hypothetical protein